MHTNLRRILTGVICCLLCSATACRERDKEEPDSHKQALLKRFAAAKKLNESLAKSEELLAIINDQFLLGDLSNAKETLEVAVQTIPNVKNPVQRSRLYADLSVYESRAARPKQAQAALQLAQTSITEIQDDPQGVAMAMNRVVLALHESKEFATAIETLDQVIVLVNKIPDLEQRARAWADVARTQAFLDRQEQMQLALDQSIATTLTVTDPRIRCDLLVETAGQLLVAKQKEKAIQILEQTEHIAEEIQDELSRSFALMQLVDRWVQTELYERAEKTMENIEQFQHKITGKDIKNQIRQRLELTRAVVKKKIAATIQK